VTGGPQRTSPSGASQTSQPSGQTPRDASTPATTPGTSAAPAAQTSASRSPGSDPAQSASRQTEPGNSQTPAQSQTAPAPKNALADKPPTLTNLRQEFEKVNREQYNADKHAIETGQTTLDKLPADRRENLQRGNDILEQYAKYKQDYKSSLDQQKTTLNDVKQLREDAIKERDKAAVLGKVGSVGLGVINAGDALANAAAASKIPVVAQLGYAYVAGRGLGDKLVSAASKIDEFFGGKGSEAVNRAIDNKVDSALGGNTAFAPERPGSAERGGGSSGLQVSSSQKAEKSGLEQTTDLAQGTRDGQAAATGMAGMKSNFERADARFKAGEDINDDSKKPFSQVDQSGKIADKALKVADSVVALEKARDSGDEKKIADAGLKVAATTADTAHVMAESLEKQATAKGGEVNKWVSRVDGLAQATRAGVGGFQAGRNFSEIPKEYREHGLSAAVDKGAEGVKNLAEVWDKGKNVESAIKSKQSLEKALETNDALERNQYIVEAAGHAVGAADSIIPGAGNASQALLSTGQVMQNVREYNEFSSNGSSDVGWTGINRFQSTINRNDDMVNWLDQQPEPQIQIQRR
jgi:hypothetical protein